MRSKHGDDTAGIARGPLLNAIDRAVRGPIVTAEDFEIVVVLIDRTADRFVDVGDLVVTRQVDGDERLGHRSAANGPCPASRRRECRSSGYDEFLRAVREWEDRGRAEACLRPR